MDKFICENCGKEHDGSYGSGRFCSKHCSHVYVGKKIKRATKNLHKSRKKAPYGTWKCKSCGKILETKKLLVEHYKLTHVRKDGQIWNKGLTKETDERVRKRANTLKQRYKIGEIIPSFKGKHWTEEQKKHISEIRKKYLSEHPEKVPYLLNHSSKMSYPEKYFNYIITIQHINANFHLQVGKYQLDFYNQDLKKYLEIDGESHYTDKKTINIDKERTKFLFDNGWIGKRIRWSWYKKLTLEKRKQIINDIKEFFKK